ncbi:enosf1 [Symbiodinium necroappetens]|uniref:L-fuconate dehydratase n=1 Tax=Symbiodinium necroappetens TaxID=1628268 RepID=A0A812ZN57_9DINO|nr:enosf1 [Symbiodinium necroappetens]
MTTCISAIEVNDIRFPTSRFLHGSDAMNPDPDYSAAYCTIRTSDDTLYGCGLTFTIGRGTELCVAAIQALAPRVIGLKLDDIEADLAGFWRSIVGDSQLRWLGPEKGVVHLAAAAVVNGVWDLLAKRADKPLWRYLTDMSPEQLVSAVDFTNIRDVMDADRALDILKQQLPHKEARIQELARIGHPAYTTSAGWLGYPDEQIEKLARQAAAEGWRAIKIKVGRDLQDDIRRCALIRKILGDDLLLMIDANQVWEVDQAIDWVNTLAPYKPHWIEEPINPDDILGHARIKQAVAPIKVATGEHCHNRIMFKQFLQADAIDFVQIDACRLGGVNEVLAVLLMAAAYDKPVCPHAGGVGLCEYVQHLSYFDTIAISGGNNGQMIEHAGHLHEHFIDPIRISNGHYVMPELPGYSVEMHAESIRTYEFPNGSDYGWLSPADKVLYRDYLPPDLTPMLTTHQIDASIVVQAAPTVDESRFLLKLAEASNTIAGVVGWVDMTSAEAVNDLEALSEHTAFLGIRPMIQDIEDRDWMLSDVLHPSFKKLQSLQLTFDALVTPVHLSYLLELLHRYPDMKTVIDHGAKPDIAAGNFQLWTKDMKLIAEQTNAYCKVSGLITEAGPKWCDEDIYPVMDQLYNWFGPRRLIWGSDWPVLNLAGNYDRWWRCMSHWLEQFPQEERDQIMGTNAAEFYLSTQGIGRATAAAFHANGACVIATDINPELLAALQNEFPDMRCEQMDVTSSVDISAVASKYPDIDILFNCAGFVDHGSLLETEEDALSRSFDLNVISMYRTIKQWLPNMLSKGRGSIVNMSSVASSVSGVPDRFIYGTTKAAVIGLTRSIAADFVQHAEIAALAVYLASDEASFTTGTTHVIDGGWSN